MARKKADAAEAGCVCEPTRELVWRAATCLGDSEDSGTHCELSNAGWKSVLMCRSGQNKLGT
jgi:hypothetical protein